MFGPRQDPGSPYSGVISLFVKWLLAGERPTIYGDGEQTRDFTYVANVVDGVLRACEAPGASGESINVATEGRDLAQPVARRTAADHRHDVSSRSTARRASATCATRRRSIAKARRILGYEPSVPFEEGLRQTVAWFRES